MKEVEEDSLELKILMGDFRLKIVEKLNDKGWNAAKLAEECGINYLTVVNMLKAKHAPNLRTVMKVLNTLGLTLEVRNVG